MRCCLQQLVTPILAKSRHLPAFNQCWQIMHICSSNELQAPACCRSFQIRNKSSWFCGSDLRLCRFQKLYRWDGWGLMLRLLSAPPGFNWWIYFAPVFKRWFIDKYGAFHANQTSMLPNPLHNWWRDWYSKTSLSPQAIFLLTVPRRCLFSGSFSLFFFFCLCQY